MLVTYNNMSPQVTHKSNCNFQSYFYSKQIILENEIVSVFRVNDVWSPISVTKIRLELYMNNS